MGYDESLFIKPLDAYWICPICDDVIQDAVGTPCCDKVFCHSCLSDWITTHQKNCPNCRTKLDAEQIQKRDKRTNKFIREQLIRCPQLHTHDCSWTGHVEDLDDHVAHACQSGVVNCPFNEMGCHAKMTRSELSVHLQEQTTQHLTLALLKIGDLNREIVNLKSKMEVTEQITSITKSIQHLKSELLPLRDSTMALSGYCIITIPRAEFMEATFNQAIDSSLFEYGGYRWKIKVYPRGNIKDKEGYPAFYLWSEHNFDQNPKDIETHYTLSFENKNHQLDVVGKHHGILGANFTFSKNNGNGWSLKSMNERFTTEYIANPVNGFIHEDEKCLHIRACILDVKPRTRTPK